MTFRDLYKEHAARIAIGALVLTATAAVLLYTFGALPEPIAGIGLGTMVVLGAGGYALRDLLERAAAPWARMLGTALILGGLSVSAASVLETLLPSEPVAQATLRERGDEMPLPDDLAGPVRVLMRGRPAGAPPTSVDVVLKSGPDTIEGHFSRTQVSARVGRGGRAQVIKEHGEESGTLELEAGSKRLALVDVNGVLEMPLSVEIFREWLPLDLEMQLDVVLLVIITLLSGAIGARSTTPALAGAMAFGAMVHRYATPEAAVKPELAALAIGFIGGSAVGALLTWSTARLLGLRGASAPARG